MTWEVWLYLVVIPCLAAFCGFSGIAWILWKFLSIEEDTDIEKYTELLRGFGFSELKCDRVDNQLIEKLPANKYLRGSFYNGWESVVLDSGTPNNSFAWMHFDRWGKFIAYGARA